MPVTTCSPGPWTGRTTGTIITIFDKTRAGKKPDNGFAGGGQSDASGSARETPEKKRATYRAAPSSLLSCMARLGAGFVACLGDRQTDATAAEQQT